MENGVDLSRLRLSVEVGEIAVYNSRLARIEARLGTATVRVRDLANGDIEDVSIGTLRSRGAESAVQTIDAHLETARASGGVAWQRAADREETLQALVEGTGRLDKRVKAVMLAQGVSCRSVYRWLARYRNSATTSALIPIPLGVVRGAHRLDANRE